VTQPDCVPLCWDEGPGAATPYGMTGRDCSAMLLPSLCLPQVSSAVGVLQQLLQYPSDDAKTLVEAVQVW
jgi:hypothetical protein